jgi:hypothetical protein
MSYLLSSVLVLIDGVLDCLIGFIDHLEVVTITLSLFPHFTKARSFPAHSV